MMMMMMMEKEDGATRKGPWTEEEDAQLVFYVKLFGDRRWDFIAKVSGLKVAGDKRDRFEKNRQKLQASLGQLLAPWPQKGQDGPTRRAPRSRAPLQMGQQMVENSPENTRAHGQRDQELLEDPHEEEGSGEEERRRPRSILLVLLLHLLVLLHRHRGQGAELLRHRWDGLCRRWHQRVQKQDGGGGGG